MKTFKGQTGRRYRIRRVVTHQLEVNHARGWIPLGLPESTVRACRGRAARIEREAAEFTKRQQERAGHYGHEQ